MKNFKFYILLAIVSVFSFTSCEEDVEAPGTNYVTFESTSYEFEITPDGTTTRDIHVYSANVTGSDRTYSVDVLDSSTADPSIYSVPATVTIPGGSNVGTLAVTASDIDLGTGKTVVLSLDPMNDSKSSVGGNITLNLKQECLANRAFLSITFDSWPEEVYWDLIDINSGTTVAASATPPAYGAYDGASGSITIPLCLPDGDYIFRVFDAYGDGAGAISMTNESGATIFSTNGNYGTGTSFSFSL